MPDDLTPAQISARDADLADPHVRETFRVIAWRKLGRQLDFIPDGWPQEISANEIWEYQMRMNPDDDWNADWRVRARALDSVRDGLEAMREELDARAAALAADEAAKAAMAAPPTAEEAEALDVKRVAAWFAFNLGPDADISAVSGAAFAKALQAVPPAGWPSGDEKSHLIALRQAVLEPYVAPEPDQPDEVGGGLAALR